MALVFTPLVSGESRGNRRETVTSVALDNLYTTGGYVLTAANLGLSNVVYGDADIVTTVAAGPGAPYLDCTSTVAPKLKLQLPTHVGEIAANATLTGATIVISAYGNL